jgi:site-specific recombinase XerD
MESSIRATVEELLKRLEGAYAKATLRAYRADFHAFISYCEALDLASYPATPGSVAGFVERLSESGLRSSSIRRAIAGIATLHNLSRLPDPTKDPEVKLAMRRMHRTLGRAARQAQALHAEELEQLLMGADDSLRGLRDRALLLLAYDTLCRRSELVSLAVEDLKPQKVLLRRSKTDPHGLGRWLQLSRRTDAALHAWLSASGITSGPLFRGITASGALTQGLCSSQVNRILKRLARTAQIEPSAISGHSLRVGAAQDLLKKGVSLPTIMHRGRWSKTDTVMRYLESAPLTFEEEESQLQKSAITPPDTD